jgi:hypothetical protein
MIAVHCEYSVFAIKFMFSSKLVRINLTNLLRLQKTAQFVYRLDYFSYHCSQV